MNELTQPGSLRKRSLAIWIELLPVLAIPTFLIFGALSAEWLGAVVLPLFFVTGGWALRGRWRLGIALGLLRLAVLTVSWAAFSPTSPLSATTTADPRRWVRSSA